jgi:hypothetical protein
MNLIEHLCQLREDIDVIHNPLHMDVVNKIEIQMTYDG